MDRRSLLRGVAAGGATVALAACSPGGGGSSDPASSPSDRPSTSDQAGDSPRVLLVFFSRAGENYYYGDRTDLEVGNTAVLAGMIRDRIDCDVHEILAADPYPESYDQTVDRNTREKSADARPEIANDLPDVSGYDTVLLASPIWSSRAPMIMSTFCDSVDLSAKTVHPVVTYAVSGLASTESDYADLCPDSMIGEGLAVQGEVVADSGPDVDRWLTAQQLV